jgi:hypothetical protein
MSAFDPKWTSTLWARRYELVREPRSLREWTARRPRFDSPLARLTRKHIGHVRPSVASQPKACLLLTDLNSNERGDTHEGSVL